MPSNEEKKRIGIKKKEVLFGTSFFFGLLVPKAIGTDLLELPSAISAKSVKPFRDPYENSCKTR
jgi:hypothetical protein